MRARCNGPAGPLRIRHRFPYVTSARSVTIGGRSKMNSPSLAILLPHAPEPVGCEPNRESAALPDEPDAPADPNPDRRFPAGLLPVLARLAARAEQTGFAEAASVLRAVRRAIARSCRRGPPGGVA